MYKYTNDRNVKGCERRYGTCIERQTHLWSERLSGLTEVSFGDARWFLREGLGLSVGVSSEKEKSGNLQHTTESVSKLGTRVVGLYKNNRSQDKSLLAEKKRRNWKNEISVSHVRVSPRVRGISSFIQFSFHDRETSSPYKHLVLLKTGYVHV